MEAPKPPQRQVVLVGGGQTHVALLRMWGMRRMREAQAVVKAPVKNTSAKPASETPQVSNSVFFEAEEIMRSLLEDSSSAASRGQNGLSTLSSSSSATSSVSGLPSSLSKTPTQNRQVPFSSVSLILVTESPTVTYSAMTSGFICGMYTESDMTIDLGPLCAFAGATLIISKAESLCPRERLLKLRGGRPPLYYDVISICCGSLPKIPEIVSTDYVSREEGASTEVDDANNPTFRRSNLRQPCVGGTGALDDSFNETSAGYYVTRGCGLVDLWVDLKRRLRMRFQEVLAEREQETGFDLELTEPALEEQERRSSSSAGKGEGPDDSDCNTSRKEGRHVFTVAVVGAGALGVELALSLQWAIKQEIDSLRRAHCKTQQTPGTGGFFGFGANTNNINNTNDDNDASSRPVKFNFHIALLMRGGQVLHSFSPKAQALARKLLDSRGVQVLSNFCVTTFERDSNGGGICIAEDGRSFSCDSCIVCTGGSPQNFVLRSGLPLDKDGFIIVRPTLQSETFPEVFAAGDIACMKDSPRPKAGVFAVRAAPVLERNIWAYLRGQPLVPFKAQEVFLCLLLTGAKEALLCRGPIVTHNSWAWKLKRYIDETWVHSFRELPSVPDEGSAPSGGYLGGVKALLAAASEGARAVSSWIPFKRDAQTKASRREVPSCLTYFASLLAAAVADGQQKPRCAGCGAKIPATTLRAALDGLRKLDDGNCCDKAGEESTNNNNNPTNDNKESSGGTKCCMSGPAVGRGKGLLLCRRNEVLSGISFPDDAAVFCASTPSPAAVAAASVGDLNIAASEAMNDQNAVFVQSVDSIRFFTGDFYCMGRVAAAHAVSDIYAMGAEPLTAMVVANIPLSEEGFKANALLNLLAGCASVLTAENCQIIGGHSSEVEEAPGCAVVVTGRLSRNEVPRGSRMAQLLPREPSLFPKGSFRVKDGCVLLLTKALGTGVIFAAHMRSKASAVWVEEALEQMQQTNREAMKVLQRFRVCACTDVSGFGLAGHLAEMIEVTNQGHRLAALCKTKESKCLAEKEQVSGQNLNRRRYYSRSNSSSTIDDSSPVVPGVRARVWLERLQTLPGVVELTMEGVVSSLFLENSKVAKRLRVVDVDPEGAPLSRDSERGCSSSVVRTSGLDNANRTDGTLKGFLSAAFLRRRSAQRSSSNVSVLLFPVLFDPQTSGGLLAAVPPETAGECLKALKALGPAAAIGKIVANKEGSDYESQPLIEVVP